MSEPPADPPTEEPRPNAGADPERGADPKPAATGADPEPDVQTAQQARQSLLQSGFLRRLRTARAALTVIRGYSFTGLLLAIGLGAFSFFHYEAELPRWICRVGAMGSLLGAVVGLNVMDRLVRGRPLPLGMVITALSLIAVALLGVGLGAQRYALGAGWSPLTAACYVIVGVRIMLRFRAPG